MAEPDRTEWLVAHEQIRQLASRYAVAMGRRDFEALAALFVPDVRVGPASGPEALAADFRRQLEPLGRVTLHVTNHVIDIGSAAEATGIVGTRAELEIGGDWIVQMIEYDDTYRRVDGEWRFVRRRHHLLYGAPIGVNPLTLPPADWPASPTGIAPEPPPSRPRPTPSDSVNLK